MISFQMAEFSRDNFGVFLATKSACDQFLKLPETLEASLGAILMTYKEGCYLRFIS